MAKTTRSASAPLLLFMLLALAATPASANLFSLSASGTISINTSGDAAIPIGTPWTFQLTYDTNAPDLDFEMGGSPDPTFGQFSNASSPPALVFFHYRAGSYEVTLDDPADFGIFSNIQITFLAQVHAIDINIHAPALFPPLKGTPVSFHADFNAFSAVPIFTNDALPTNTALAQESFDQSTVTLLPTAGEVSGSSLTSLTLAAVPEQPISGDLNGDAALNNLDIDPFALALSDREAYDAAFPGLFSLARADINGDGQFNNLDIAPFAALLTGGAQTAAPEPCGLLLALLGCAGLWALQGRT